MKLIFKYLLKHKKLLVLNLFSVFGFALVELGLPTMLARIIDLGITEQNPEMIKQTAMYMLLIVAAGAIGLISLAYFASLISSLVIEEIRNDIFNKTRDFSAAEINHFGVSSLMTRTNNDAYQLLIFIQMMLRTGMMSPVIFISSIYMCVRTSPSLAMTLLIALPLLIIAVVWMAKKTEPISQRQQKNLDAINRKMREGLTGIRVIRAFVREKFQQNRFEDSNEDYTKQSKKLFYILALAGPAFGLLLFGMIGSIIWFGGNQIALGTLKIGSMAAFIEYIFHSLFSLMMFTTLFSIYPKTVVSAGRIQEVLETTPIINANEDGVVVTEQKGYVEFKDVSFAYVDDQETQVLSHINFTAKPGETIAFIGSTGSGKSSLIHLIPRFNDVIAGSVLVDGIDVREYNLEALRRKIGFIPQRSVLFSGTIADNLRYGNPDATQADLERAAEVAQALDFIQGKDEKFDFWLAEGGTNLSGGQKQRLSIARALVRQPEVYIFDDSFSALDYKTDAKLREALKGYTQDSTILIVAQRVGTIMNADKIIVLDDGKIVGMGKHKDLLKDCDVYYQIAASQLSKEELA